MRESAPPALSASTGGFGLVNVNLRLRLYYNQQDGLTIKSGPGGTSVSFRVPCRISEELAQEAKTAAPSLSS